MGEEGIFWCKPVWVGKRSVLDGWAVIEAELGA